MKKNYVCPNCGTEIGSNQCDCPNCGCSISLVEIDEQQIESDEKTSRSKLIWYLLRFIFIIGAFIIHERKQGQQQLLEQERIEQQRIEQRRIEQQRLEQERREQQRLEQERREREQRQRELENKWKKFAGSKYKATTLVANFPQHYAFSYDESGHGKYIVFTTYPGTDVVEKMIMEADIYSVTSDGDYLYLYIDGLRSPARVEINGNSLYTMGGGERYYIW